MTRAETLPERVKIRGIGRSLDLRAPQDATLRADALWRLRTHYSPALSAWTFAPKGLALDIGAGFGSFAVPFARICPGWTVLAFEPDPAAHAAALANAAEFAHNLIVLPCAVGGAEARPADPAAVRAALAEVLSGTPGAVERLVALLPLRPHGRRSDNVSYLQAGFQPGPGWDNLRLPTLSADLLAELSPNLLKIVAPQADHAILPELARAPLDHILGESWSCLAWGEVCGPELPGRRQCWLPVAGPGLLALRNSGGPSTLRPGLDVVVALYNMQDYILPCIEGILAFAGMDIRVLVVDDGSTDDSADRVRAAFAEDPRVVLITKPNGGCASARNYGRMMSDSSHIAFVDADDLPDEGLFPMLLELARQTGAEMVQSGFHFLTGEDRTPSSEQAADAVSGAFRHPFFTLSCHLQMADWLATCQPAIWRRVYRRDFLDTKAIWFPEHVRAFDDQVFQLVSLHQVVNLPTLDGLSYGYRQHPGQDVKQRDTRLFNSLEMFRMALRRGLTEGWSDFRPLMISYIHTINWSTDNLPEALAPDFLRGAAELWVLAGKILPDLDRRRLVAGGFGHPAMAEAISRLETLLADLPASAAYAHLDALQWHAGIMRKGWAG